MRFLMIEILFNMMQNIIADAIVAPDADQLLPLRTNRGNSQTPGEIAIAPGARRRTKCALNLVGEFRAHTPAERCEVKRGRRLLMSSGRDATARRSDYLPRQCYPSRAPKGPCLPA